MWLPGFERWEIPGRPGVPYDEYDDPKCMWHSTQGSSIEGAVSAYSAYPPQLIVDPWRKRKVQHISLMSAGYALWNEDVDDSRCIQVEIVGFSETAPDWPEHVWKWLGEEVARPLHEHFGVPYVAAPQGFKSPAEVDFILASASSPLRFTQWEIDHFSGHLAHQHSPGDNHWDVPLKIDKILQYAQGNRKDKSVIRLIKGDQRDEIFVVAFTGDGIQRRYVGTEAERELLEDLSGETVRTVDQWKIDTISTRSLIGDAVWNAEIPVEDSDNPSAFRPAHRVVAGVYENVADVIADVDEEALAAALAAHGIGGASPAEVKNALAEVLRSVAA